MTPEKAKEILKFLVEGGGIERTSHIIADVLLYRADPKFWDDLVDNLTPTVFISDQAEADRIMASLKEHFEEEEI